MTPPHLVVFAAFYPPFTGGYPRNIQQLARRLVRRGWRVTVISSDVEAPELSSDDEGVRVERLPCWNALGTYPIPKLSRRTRQVLRLLWRERIDVISTQTRFFPTSMLGLFVSLWRRVPIVHTERGSVHTAHGNPVVRLINLAVDHTFGAWLVRRAKCAVGVSAPARTFCEHLGARRTAVIPNGIDIERYQPAPSRQPRHPVTIVYVGRLIWAKGIHDLIQVLAQLRADGRDVQLEIVGVGPYEPELRSLVSTKHLGEAVKFLGEIALERIPQALQGADLFINPSYSEGLPTSVMEAAAAGLPIVAADAGGTREIVEDGVNGLVVPPKDLAALRSAIERLLDDRALARTFGQRARQHVADQFGWERITDRYDRLYRQAVAGANG